MTLDAVRSELSLAADAAAGGAVAAALAGLKSAFDQEPSTRSSEHLSELHRETLLHKASASRLERDTAMRRLPREAEIAERARLTAAVLDLIDDMARVESAGAIRFKVDPRIMASRATPIATAGEQAAGGLVEPQSADVFLSYARDDRALVTELAAALSSRSVSVWFDHFIAGGARYRETINARLDAAKVVIALWTEHSIASDWVLYESDRAHKARKLLPLRHPSLALDRVPPPYAAVLNVLAFGDMAAVEQALGAFGLTVARG